MGGVVSMTKGLKTFNLRHSTIAIVKKKPNQSEFVDRAINRLHNQEGEFSLLDIETTILLRTLVRRAGCPAHIKAVISEWLSSNG